jgi:hypothetical protein
MSVAATEAREECLEPLLILGAGVLAFTKPRPQVLRWQRRCPRRSYGGRLIARIAAAPVMPPSVRLWPRGARRGACAHRSFMLKRGPGPATGLPSRITVRFTLSKCLPYWA